jgi:hypothetical protein
MAALGFHFGRRLYPIPFEWGRLARTAGVALGCFAVSRAWAPATLAATLALEALALLLFPLGLLAGGVLNAAEREQLARLLRRLRAGARQPR